MPMTTVHWNKAKYKLGCLVSPETRKPLNTHHMSGPYTLRFFYENSGKKVPDTSCAQLQNAGTLLWWADV